MSGSDASAPRPTVTLKIATSLDGRIATASGESQWITGEAAREEVHRLRATHDAVLVGSQTVLDDDPELTVRLPGYDGPQPLRVVADGRFRTSPSARLVATASSGRPVLIVTNKRDDVASAEFFSSPSAALCDQDGVRLHVTAGPARDEELTPEGILGRICLNAGALLQRPELRSPSILLEGGGKLAASFLRADLIDRIEWFRAPIILGGDAKPAVAALELGRLAAAPRFKRVDVKEVGDDLWERYEWTE